MIRFLQRSFLFTALLFCGFCSLMGGQESSVNVSAEPAVKNNVGLSPNFAADPVEVQLVADSASIQPGHTFWMAVRLQMADHWHTYWKNPGDVGIPVEVKWQLPEGFQVSDIQWPYPSRIADESGMVTFGYEGVVYLLAEVTAPAELSADSSVDISAKVSWLACKDSCVPGTSNVSLHLPVTLTTPKPDLTWVSALVDARTKLPLKGKAVSTEMDGQKRSFQLILPLLASGSEYLSAYFFADGAQSVDYNSPQKLFRKGSRQRLSVHSAQPGHIPTEPLRGVLVVVSKTAGKEMYSAYEVDVPLVPDATRAIEKMHEVGQPNMDLALAIALAFIGGMILNLMPCVLPVIALKIMSFVKLSGESRITTIKHGAAFFMGALIAFWALAGVLLAFRAYGQVVGWGFQLQSPLFVSLLAFVLMIFGLSLFGVFEMGTGISSLAGNAQPRNRGLWGSFFSGILATAVATPCTGPFLGTTVGFAVTLPALGALSIFTAMGIGMALPYLLFAFFPSLIRFLPKPGPWMVIFKELMGFVILATVLWLLWVFGAQTSTMGLMLVLAGFLIAAIGCWVYGKWASPVKHLYIRFFGMAIAAALLLGGLWIVVQASDVPAEEVALTMQTENCVNAPASEDGWISFCPEKLEELRQKGVPVFVDFTAKWCLICQANKLVINSDEVIRRFEERGVVKMHADWTKNDEQITTELRKYGRSGVPLYLYYGPESNSDPQILPQVLTPDVLITTVEEAGEAMSHIAN